MGVRCSFWEETPERVQYYLDNHEWPTRGDLRRDNLHLEFFEAEKSWTGLHCLLYLSTKQDTFPANFIENGTRLPNYEYSGDGYGIELTSPFLYSVAETKKISEFLDSLDKAKLRQSFDPRYLVRAFPYEYFTNEKDQVNYFHWLYSAFEELQRFFHTAASHEHCVVGRKM
jgi:hypothetical protein